MIKMIFSRSIFPFCYLFLLLFPDSDNMRFDDRAGVREGSGICKI